MNKTLYVARKSKGLTESEVAKALDIEENEYKELEYGIKRMTSEPAEKLGELFNIDPDYFMAYEYGNLQDLKDVLEKHRDLLNAPEYKECEEGDGKVHLAIARMGLEASIAI